MYGQLGLRIEHIENMIKFLAHALTKNILMVGCINTALSSEEGLTIIVLAMI